MCHTVLILLGCIPGLAYYWSIGVCHPLQAAWLPLGEAWIRTPVCPLVLVPGAPDCGAQLGVTLIYSRDTTVSVKTLATGSFKIVAFFWYVEKLFLRCHLASFKLYPITFRY